MRKSNSRWFLATALTTLLAFAPISDLGAFDLKPKYGPSLEPKAIPLHSAFSFFQNPTQNQDQFWALISYYVPQANGASCSAASAAMVINAARAKLNKVASDKVITEKMLLDRIKIENWHLRLHPGGDHGKHGIHLDGFAKVMQQVFLQNGFPKAKVSAVHVNGTDEKSKSSVVHALMKLSLKSFMIVNFNQKSFTNDADVGHFAPVAAYDPKAGKVLILDPDREYYEPYWVSVDSFVSGMVTTDSSVSTNRGYITIELD